MASKLAADTVVCMIDRLEPKKGEMNETTTKKAK